MGDASETIASVGEQQPAVSGWEKAKKVVKLLQVSQGFNTLRDMLSEEAVIDSKRLRIHSTLGEGAFAIVSLGTLDGSRAVAVKCLKPGLIQNPAEVKLFLSENDVLRKLRHRNIVELIGIGGAMNKDGSYAELYIVQELCPGGSLRDLVFKQMTSPHSRLYSKRDALKWSLDLAKALTYLHDAKPKVIHRDLKLDNVLLSARNTSQATAKLADFGLARLVINTMKKSSSAKLLETYVEEGSSRTSSKTSRSLAVQKTMKKMSSATISIGTESIIGSDPMTGEAGSYGYMAPEVLQGKSYDEKADIFSFAMVMYNLFYSIIPSVLVMSSGNSDDMVTYAWEVANGFRPKLDPRRAPEEINTLIDACWNGIPSLRPSADEIVETLRHAVENDICAPKKPPDGAGGKCCTLM